MKNVLIRVLLCIYLPVFIFSCRKPDMTSQVIITTEAASKAAVEKFLTVPVNAGPELTAIIKDLRSAEERHPFLWKQIAANGMPNWSATISNKSLLTDGIDQKTAASEIDNEQSRIFFIPLQDSVTNEVKAFVYCLKFAEGSFRYKVYNKQYLLSETVNTPEARANSIILMNVFATFENRINHKSIMQVGGPFSFTFQDADMKFIETPVTVSRVAENSTSKSVKINDDCPWYTRSQTVLFTAYGLTESIPFEWVWLENACTHETQLVGIFRIGGATIGGSSGGSSGGYEGGSSGGSSSNPTWWGASWADFWDFYGNTNPTPVNGVPGYGSIPAGYIPGGPSDDPFGDSGGSGGPLFYLTPAPGASGYSPLIAALDAQISLTTDQKDWLYVHPEVALSIVERLQDEDVITPEIIAAANVTIDLARAGLINSVGPGFSDILISHIQNLVFFGTGIDVQLYIYALNANVAILKKVNPDWNIVHIYYEACKETLQFGLDMIGLVPVIGEVADIANGVIYTLDGNATMASLSFAAAVPVTGWYAASVKLAMVTTITPLGKTTLKWIKLTTNQLGFGARSQLRKVLGLGAGNALQAHHIIPWQFCSHDLVQMAAKENVAIPFHMNNALNGIPLSKSVHVEGMAHPAYNTAVNNALDAIVNRYGSSLTPTIAKQELDVLIGKIKNWINTNPGVNLDNIVIP